MDDYEVQIKNLEDIQRKKAMQELEAKKTSSLSPLASEEEQTKVTANKQRGSANVGSQIQKLNFAEFMARRGQTNSGIAQASEISRGNVLARNIGDITQAETTNIQDINRRKSDIEKGFATDVASVNLGLQADTASKLLAYKEKLREERLAKEEQLRREALDKAEQLRREEVARQNSERDYQRQLALKSASSNYYDPNDLNGNGIADNEEGQAQNSGQGQSFADNYFNELVTVLDQAGTKANPQQIESDLGYFKSQGQLNDNEIQAIKAELSQRGYL